MKLNLGCGLTYKKGFVNLDINKNIKADIYHDMNNKLPFNDHTFDYILADNCLNYSRDIITTLRDLYRITKPNGTIDVYAIHYTSPYALKHLFHNCQFGVGSLDIMSHETGLDRMYDDLNFKVEKEKLFVFLKCYDGKLGKICKFINHFNFLFNFTQLWRIFCERFWIFGFDEIYYKLRVIK